MSSTSGRFHAYYHATMIQSTQLQKNEYAAWLEEAQWSVLRIFHAGLYSMGQEEGGQPGLPCLPSLGMWQM